MSLKIRGFIKKIMPTETVGDSFQKRTIVVETDTDTKYPQEVPFELHQDRCTLADAYSEGQQVEVSFNLRGREWQGRYYANIVAWKLAPIAPVQMPPNAYITPAPIAQTPTSSAQVEEVEVEDLGEDDLPF